MYPQGAESKILKISKMSLGNYDHKCDIWSTGVITYLEFYFYVAPEVLAMIINVIYGVRGL